jgi:hypothetical protein
MWWVVLAVGGCALVLLVLALLGLLVRLIALARAAARLRDRMRALVALQESVAHLQGRLDTLSEQAAGIQERIAARRGSPRGGKG